MGWGNAGLARQLEFDDTEKFYVFDSESLYIDDIDEQVIAENQVEDNPARSKVRASTFARLFFLVFLYAVALVFISNYTATLGYDVVQMEKDNRAIGDENKRLLVEIEKLKSLDRIESLAVSQMNMVHATRQDSIKLGDVGTDN